MKLSATIQSHRQPLQSKRWKKRSRSLQLWPASQRNHISGSLPPKTAFRDRPIYSNGDTIHDPIIILDDGEADQGQSPELRDISISSQALRLRTLKRIVMRRNSWVGKAKSIRGHRIKQNESLERVQCACDEDKCGMDCQNRAMLYECDSSNCVFGDTCTNRAFQTLEKKRDIRKVGVKIIETTNRGFGIIATKNFEPGELILEYTGEIIVLNEALRRARKWYKASNYNYLLEPNLVIDATRGDIASFVNHSCMPNCTVTTCHVLGTPRIGIFAGFQGVRAGVEVTINYNFMPFPNAQVEACYCGSENCRGYIGPKNARISIH